MATSPPHDRIVRLFEEHFGRPPRASVEMKADGSNRRYFRLVDDEWNTAVGAIGPDREENRAFLSFSHAFHTIDLPVPVIYGADEEAGVWLEEDLGETTLFDALTEARQREGGPFPESMIPAYERVLSVLPRFQVEGGRVIDYAVAYPRDAFDRQSILWDLNYFKYHFLKLAQIPFSEARLEEDFERLTDFALEAEQGHFLYRDFQSRNIMLRDDGEPWFIDYQGGRRGALQYDVASLLYDAKAAIPDTVRKRLLESYLDALHEAMPVDRDLFRRHYVVYVLIRVMQAMGAYGYRGYFERKPRFLHSVPFAARNIERLLADGLPLRVPELERVYRSIVERYAHDSGDHDEETGLTVHIGSFSYRRGYPEDHGGHGGGFVFDCRAIPNPGRQLEYQALCGRDEEVIGFLEGCGEVGEYWDNVRSLVGAQVREYLRRGFSSLTVMFGCTGGQHRSVYFAERIARHLRESFPEVHVRVTHREQADWPGQRERPNGNTANAGSATAGSQAGARGGRRKRVDAGAGGA
ncbi:MAG TPA: RNase adapter RapZ [Longimicrobiales bacterium]|nr:RNase adapter RapZ [Longimicrobiales bacterium]